jgi:hypothetical protein
MEFTPSVSLHRYRGVHPGLEAFVMVSAEDYTGASALCLESEMAVAFTRPFTPHYRPGLRDIATWHAQVILYDRAPNKMLRQKLGNGEP